MNRLIRVAVALLPVTMRERYREQWLADLRDAPDAGIPRSQIAWGALAFAMAAPRRWPALPALDRARTARIAFALALTSALLGLTRYPGYEIGANVLSVWSPLRFGIDAVMLVVEVLGPIVATVLTVRGRELPGAERLAVGLLVLASAAPLAPLLLGWGGDLYFYPGALAFAVAVVLVVVALVVRTGRAPTTRRPAAPGLVALAASTVAALGSLGLFGAVSAWAGRVPLVTDYAPDSPGYTEWVDLKTAFEARVDGAFVVSALVVLLLVAGVVAVGALGLRPGLGMSTATAVLVVVLGYAQLSQFLELGTPTAAAVIAPTLLITATRIALIATVFVGVDGIRRRRQLAVRTS